MTATPASLTWLDLTASDRDNVRRVLDLFEEQGTIDELGLGAVRDFFSDTLFPGTSTLHTRLRYVLFIPWLYRRLEARYRQVQDIAAEARAEEIRLIEALLSGGEEEGVIGAVARERLSRLPSQAYWSALVRWGLFGPRQSQGWYHRHFKRLAAGLRSARPDDAGELEAPERTWHPQLPGPPEGLLETATFALTAEEAGFLRDRMESAVPGSLLAHLVREGSTALGDARWLWEAPEVGQAPGSLRELVAMARRFSLHMEGAPLLYNLYLAELRRERHGDPQGVDAGHIERYREALARWAEAEEREDPFDPEALWQLGARHGAAFKEPLKRFVAAWSEGLNRHGAAAVADSGPLRDLVAQRERALKGARARVVNANRLDQWRGGAGVGRLDFRWPNVRRLLVDLHEGLAA
ncbi:DUF6361 family protein [Halorhodospira neutriphila]|uniref:Zorya protein ZorC EH domain-containing protein n=1 Tax=Halorhodospira neutriphila TaxID=168379 RepID=A0ABS1E1L8_9GAMM|nr:DUF6361 family protein [Halorhodospira neutriphila]MBK1725596.1 hypothetical protein [Halorhodospira neutriphila]